MQLRIYTFARTQSTIFSGRQPIVIPQACCKILTLEKRRPITAPHHCLVCPHPTRHFGLSCHPALSWPCAMYYYIHRHTHLSNNIIWIYQEAASHGFDADRGLIYIPPLILNHDIIVSQGTWVIIPLASIWLFLHKLGTIYAFLHLVLFHVGLTRRIASSFMEL